MAEKAAEDVAWCNSLSSETKLLVKFIYKNNNQHRRAGYFQHLVHLKRLLRKLSFDKGIINETRTKLNGTFELEAGMHHVSWKTLCNTEFRKEFHACLSSFQSYAIDLDKIISVGVKAFVSLRSQFSMGFFMPFTLTGQSIIARVLATCRLLLTSFIKTNQRLSVLYLRETCKANPLQTPVIARELSKFRIPNDVLQRYQEHRDQLDTTCT